MENTADTLYHRFNIRIVNLHTTTLYFMIYCVIPNWSLSIPSDGKLGAIGSGGDVIFTIEISRSKPTSEVSESGYLKIEVYTDSNYTNKVAETTLPVNIKIENLVDWQDVTIYDFTDGSSQGWGLTNCSVASDLSLEVGGYSIKTSTTSSVTSSMSRAITLPNRNKVRISFYIACRSTALGGVVYDSGISDLKVSVGTDVRYYMPRAITSGLLNNTTTAFGWLKVTADLSPYKGQSVTITISQLVWINRGNATTWGIEYWLDRIVIAGSD